MKVNKAVVAGLFLIMTAITGSVTAKTVEGSALVIDGDTIQVAQTRIRFIGLDAPESKQQCYKNEKAWQCGQASTNALRRVLKGKTVRCYGTKKSYDRLLARCKVGKNDLGQWIVSNGWAVAARIYSNEYVADETRAKQSGKGIWGSQFEMPWKFRKRNK